MSGVEPVRPPRICVVVPCYNESDCIDIFYKALKSVLDSLSGYEHQILFVDDGSRDNTLECLARIRAADPCVKFLALSRNFGHQIALSAGLDAADADLIVVMDSDLQHPPEFIPKMLEKWKEGADIVSMVRTSTQNASFLKNFSSTAFYRVINLCSEVPIAPGVADFCMMSREAHAALLKMPERHRFLRGMISWLGFNRKFIEFEAPPRAAGEAKYTFRKSLALALTAAFSNSAVPLRLATQIGLFITAAAGLYLVYVILAAIFAPKWIESGWPSLICVILILGGVQLTFTGLIGEYLARVYEEAKGRPIYLLRTHDNQGRDIS
ncbi:MAG: glycosyltransferase family 2 protein [Planctomycetales bacterium]